MLTKKEREVLRLRQKGLTQVDVARKLGITQAAVSKFENNALEKIRQAKRIILWAKKAKIEVEDDEF